MCLKGEKGQAMVEFALVLPILILLLCGIIDFSWIFSNQITANNACREAARYSAIHVNDSTTNDDQADALTLVRNIAPTLPSPTVTLVTDSSSVKVTVTAQVRVLTGVTSTILGHSDITVNAQSTMKIEQ